MCLLSFFFNDTTTTEIYTLSLHDALPILARARELFTAHRAGRSAADDRYLSHGRVSLRAFNSVPGRGNPVLSSFSDGSQDRKSTRLNSSHSQISYAVFCFKKNIALYYILR